MTGKLYFSTVAEAAELVRTRKLSPVELAQTYLDRIADLDPQLNAFITVTAELALGQALAAEREIAGGNYRGPLHGIPFGLNDIYSTRGILTSACSRVCADNVPTEDATTASRLRGAGAVLLGKLATHEFAHGGPSFDLPWPPARNPWNLEHFTGLLKRLRRRGCRRARTVCTRLRHGRFDPRAVVTPRARGAHANLRSGKSRRRHTKLVYVRSLRADGLDGRGLRHRAAGTRRARFRLLRERRR
jgi:hypothetical protein